MKLGTSHAIQRVRDVALNNAQAEEAIVRAAGKCTRQNGALPRPLRIDFRGAANAVLIAGNLEPPKHIKNAERSKSVG